MPLPFTPIPTTFVEYVTVCNECGESVSMFSLDENQRAVCVPCGHPARVSLVPNQLLEPDAAA